MPAFLPIEQIKAEFIQAITSHQTIILCAEPGAGKSTRLPLWLLEDDLAIPGKIYLLQPRRVAVKTIAYFLAKQLGEPVGKTVGYRLRNETKASKSTRLEVVTEGVLIQIMQNDPEMADTSMIILDEFHERSLQADLAFALARDIQQGLHQDLTLVLMSATLASQQLSKALPDALQLSSQGRSFPVDLHYQPAGNMRLWREHAITAIKQALVQFQGSILVFLPGSGDIRYLEQQLLTLASEQLMLCPLYGDLTLAEQQQAIAPCEANKRKIVLATNIAETSLTIEGISVVIDSGLEKVAIYDEATLTNRLQQRNIAKSSAIQRTGRAGRLASGHCIRLYAEEEFQRRNLQNALPITQADILPLVIEAARWGVQRLQDLPLLDFPTPQSEDIAWQTLLNIKVIDEKRRLTMHGQQVAELPCHARFAHMIIQARLLEKQYQVDGLAYLACILAALLEERDILKGQAARGNSDINHRVTLLMSQQKLHNHRQILQQASRLAQIAGVKPTDNLPSENSGILLFLAYPERLSKRRAVHGEYIASYGKGLYLDELDSLINAQYLVAVDVYFYQQRLNIRLAAFVDIDKLLAWKLIEISESQVCAYQADKARIVAMSQRRIGSLVLEEKNVKASVDDYACYQIWREQINKQGLSFLNWQAQDHQLLSRWRWLNQTQLQCDFPEVSEAALLQNLDVWLQPFIQSIFTKAQLLTLDVSAMLLSMLNFQQQQTLAKLAPSYFVGPTGRKCPIRYRTDQAPIVALPMQEVYGMQTSPSVGQGKYQVNLTLELLSPAQRPIQITADLAGFWQGSYRQVQKEMKAKYPKHFWPDDPANAVATNKCRPRTSKQSRV